MPKQDHISSQAGTKSCVMLQGNELFRGLRLTRTHTRSRAWGKRMVMVKFCISCNNLGSETCKSEVKVTSLRFFCWQENIILAVLSDDNAITNSRPLPSPPYDHDELKTMWVLYPSSKAHFVPGKLGSLGKAHFVPSHCTGMVCPGKEY